MIESIYKEADACQQKLKRLGKKLALLDTVKSEESLKQALRAGLDLSDGQVDSMVVPVRAAVVAAIAAEQALFDSL